MIADGELVGDGSWELSITVTDLQVEKTLRVKGDLHIGGAMLRLVESLELPMDWSDHALWWPEKNMWLGRTRSTLDQYGVQADAKLWFTPMHKVIRLQLPDLQVYDMKVNFSVSVFSAVIRLCKELGIRHPEELSLARKLEKEELKKNKGISATRRQPIGAHQNGGGNMQWNTPGMDSGYGTLPHGSPYRTPVTPNTPYGTLLRTPGTPGSPYTFNAASHSPYSTFNGTQSPGSIHSLAFEGAMESLLSNSPTIPAKEGMLMLYKPKNFAEKARINAGWLDSSRSIMEQGIAENDVVLLKFKFFNFYDLNPKYDQVRINQVYEQAKWSLISEEMDCTEEEMMMFAALQLQVQLQTRVPQPEMDGGQQVAEDDIDAALNDLQVSLEGSSISTTGDITHIPELQDYLKFFKPKKFTIKSYKKYFFVFKDTTLSMFRSKEEQSQGHMLKVNLRGCEVIPDVNISSQKFNIKLFVPSPDGLMEVWIRADTNVQYAKWMAACRLASKGKTMADSSYDSEVKTISAFLSMQQPAISSPINPGDIGDFQPDDFVASRYIKKVKNKTLATRILEAHANVKEMNLIEAKTHYIKAWQALPEYGITYFIVKMKGHKKEELLGIAFNRMILMDLHSGDSLKTWRFSEMEAWHVNWETKQVLVTFASEKLAFHCHTADCKVVHEFIGGYLFLSMRSGEKNQQLDQEQFHKLTGGWE